MKKIIFTIMIFLFLLFDCSPKAVYAYDYYHKVDVEVTEVPYKPVYAYLGLNLEAGGGYSGGGITLTSARKSDLQFTALVGYRSVSSEEANIGVFDVMIGGTYFPRRPIFNLGDMPARLRISALGGMGMSNDLLFTLMMSIGLVFSSGDDPNGFTVDLIVRPEASSGGTKVPSAAALSIGFLFAPIAEQYY